MTVDREQARRDAKFQLERSHGGGVHRESSETILALLAELEQAERQLTLMEDGQRRIIEQRDQAERQRDDYLWQRDAAKDELRAAESRLAVVPALVEAAEILVRLNLAPDVESLVVLPGEPTPLEIAAEYDGELAKLRDALAAYEQAQEQR